jgi:arsenical pump membrane protein
MQAHYATWAVAALATLGVIVRPWNLPEAVWAVLGAVMLVGLGLLPLDDALTGVGKGTDVYLFLIGMMLLAETAREQGLFDWLAAVATGHAGGSAKRLFLLIYGVGTIVTVFLSNDATAVVLTPAVAAAMRTAKVEKPLPYLLICAFIANAASFVLPISNPANLVVYGTHMPPLLRWLPFYALPSAAAILATYAALRWSQRKALGQKIAVSIAVPGLTPGGCTAALGIAATAVVLLVASGLGWPLGLPTLIAGGVTSVVVLGRSRQAPWPMLKSLSWSVLPLVGGLFVLVEALDRTGLIRTLAALLRDWIQQSAVVAAWGSGIAIAVACNLANNLPVGLVAGSVVQSSHLTPDVTGVLLIGVDLGPNLSVTGSLATILWLTALRREGQKVGAATFLKLGCLIMPPALLVAIAAALLQ